LEVQIKLILMKQEGLFVVENDEITNFYNHLNSPLENIYESDPSNSSVTVRIPGSVFDNQGNLWMTNIGASNELKKVFKWFVD